MLNKSKEHQEHKMNSHANNVSILRSNKFDCKKCPAYFSDKKELKNHMKKSHHKSYKCEDCEEILSNNYQMETHLVNVHKKIETHK